MALRRRTKKLTKSMVTKLTGSKWLTCKECNVEEVLVAMDIAAVTCAYCVQKFVAPPDNYKKEKSDKPRGWHFKVYFEHDGKIYSKGEEITDPSEIASLKKKYGKVSRKTTTPSTKSKGKKNVRTSR